MLSSCGKDKIEEPKRFIAIESHGSWSVYYDAKTGVEYYKHSGCAPIVLVNGDGTPKIVEGYND